MASLQQVVERYIDVTDGTTTEKGYIRATNMFVSGDTLYSYGSHFPLVEPIRDRDGGLRAWLLNGERFSPSTDRHQRDLRAGLKGHSIPSVIIPFTSLRSAGIDRQSIVPHEVQEDTYRYTEKKCDEPHVLHTHSMIEGTESENDLNAYVNNSASAFLGRIVYTRYLSAGETCPGGRNHINGQHFLGASVFSATVVSRNHGQVIRRGGVRFISAFDDQETRPLYFLAELPATSYAATYETALEDLRPRLVQAADKAGRAVSRQGDMFAVEPASPITRKALKDLGYTFTKRGYLHGTVHTGTEVANPPSGKDNLLTYARGQFRHEPAHREKDHIMRPIGDGKGWFIIEPNTVPRGLGDNLSMRQEPRAWTQSGGVD